MLGLGRLPREYIYRYAERQLRTVRFCLFDVIGRLGGISGPRTRQTTWGLPQGYPRLPRHRRRNHNNRDAVPGLALYLFTDVFTETGLIMEQGVHDLESNKNFYERAPRDDDGVAAVGLRTTNVVRPRGPRDLAWAV